ncbi:hypothetical protein P8452_19816 [Trifolium repens]|nr:hypothetical protein P8452_19816 [Trifolium repens]
MAHSMSLISVGLGFVQIPKTKVGVCGRFNPRSTARLRIRAVQENGGQRRLIDIIRLVPDLSKNYFRRPSRRTLFGGISLLGGFYVAQTISLSFGALAVNDVIAAVVCVLLTELTHLLSSGCANGRWEHRAGQYAKDGRIQLEFLHDKLDSLFGIPHPDYDNP